MSFVLAFDLDGTLIPQDAPFSSGLEPTGWVARLLGAEPLRAGTSELFRALRGRGCRLWVYTSSLRSPWSIRRTFAAHGLWLDGVVNDLQHNEAERRAEARWPRKFPPGFGIDLLVDDAEHIALLGRRHGFRVLRVEAHDVGWVEAVIDAAGGLPEASSSG